MKYFVLIALVAITAKAVNANKCAGQENGVHFPIDGDCENFIVCDSQQENIKECAKGLHFSPKALFCLPPDEAQCEGGHTPTQTTPTPTPTPTPSPTPSPGPNSCKGQPLGKRIPKQGVCNKFIVCIGEGVEMDCPAPLHFNPELEVCDWPQSVNCPWA